MIICQQLGSTSNKDYACFSDEKFGIREVGLPELMHLVLPHVLSLETAISLSLPLAFLHIGFSFIES